MSERWRCRNRAVAAAAAIFTWVVTPSAHAAGSGPASPDAVEVSLAELLRSAVRNDPLCVAAARDIDVAQAEREAVAGRRYPSLNSLLLAGPTPAAHGDAVRSTTPVDDYGELVRSLGPFFRAELAVTQPLYTFGKISAGESALGKLVEVRRAEAGTTRWEIATQVKSGYYGLLLVEDLLVLADEVQGYLDEAKVHLEKRLKSGDAEVTPTDRSRLAFYESEVKRQHIELVTRRAVLRDGLVRLAAIEVPPGWRLAETELSPVRVGSVDRARLLDEAVRSRPEIEAARAGVEALSSKREGMRAKYWPDVFLGGRVRYGVAPNRDRQTSPFAKDEFNFLDAGVAVGLRHEWPTGVTGREVAKVSAEIGALEARRTALEEKVSHELVAAVDEWRAAGDKIEAAKEGLKAARSWSAFARNGFELGTVPAKDLIDALIAFVRAREALLAMTHEHNAAVARLSRAAGRELLPELQAGVW